MPVNMRMAASSELGKRDTEDELESLSQILRHLDHSGSPRQHLLTFARLSASTHSSFT
jgi:hypothetical protein